MTKTIKEISQEYASGYMNLDRQQVAEQACEYGANAVLEQIESIIALQPNEPICRFIAENIKKLKT